MAVGLVASRVPVAALGAAVWGCVVVALVLAVWAPFVALVFLALSAAWVLSAAGEALSVAAFSRASAQGVARITPAPRARVSSARRTSRSR